MGLSLTAAAAIIGVSIIMAIEIIAGTVIPTIENVNESFDEMHKRSIEQIQTNINITSVTSEVNESYHDINITVKNTGKTTLETSNFNILLNGTILSFTCSKKYLYPENVVYFNVSGIEDTGIRMLKVITNNGISDYYEFII
jgi:archaellum component FlaF (FlaF/FlaG flagellin family)